MKVVLPIKINKFKKNLQRLPRILGEHFFLSFLVFAFVSVIFSGFIFYKYVFLVERMEPEIKEEPLFLKEKLYQKVLGEWAEREKIFKEAELKKYPNPFQKTTVSPEELTE